MLVEVIATKSQNIPWVISLDGQRFSNKRICRVSIDKFYEIVVGDGSAFKKLCEKLPIVIGDAVDSEAERIGVNTVFAELDGVSPNLLKSVYLLAFEKYQGFEKFTL